MVARLILNLKAVASHNEDRDEPGVISSANATGMHTMTMTAWEVAVLGDLGNELATGFTSEHSRTLRGSMMSMESFGKDDIDLDGEGYGVSKMRGQQAYTDMDSPYSDASYGEAPKPGYGSYMYGYSGEEEYSRGRDTYPPHPFAHPPVGSSRVSRPTSAGTSAASHAPLIRTHDFTSEPAMSEFDATSPTVEGSDVYERFAPPKGTGYGSPGVSYGQHDYMSDMKNNSPYLDSPAEYAPSPARTRAPRPLPSITGRQMGG